MRHKLTQLFVFHFFNDGFLASIILFLPFISKDLGLNLTQVGFLGSIFSLAGILMALPIGYISNRFGASRILIAGILFYGIGFILTGLSPSFAFLTAAFLVAAIGFGSFHPPAFSEVARLSDGKKKGRIMGDFTAIGEFGRICLSAAIPMIVVAVGWRQTSIIYAVSAGALFTFFAFRHFSNGKKTPSPHAGMGDISFFEIMKNWNFVLVLLINFFDLLASSALFVFLPFLLIKKGIDPSILGAFTSAFFLGNLIGKMLLGRMTDYFSNTKVFVVAEILMAVFIILLTLTDSIPGIITFSIILGSLTMGTVPIRTTMLTDTNNHHRSLAKAFAIGSLVASISSALAPVILGRIADMFGIINSFNVSAMFALLAVVPSTLLIANMRRAAPRQL